MRPKKKSGRLTTKDIASSKLRTRLKAGRDILPLVDGRSVIARRYRELQEDMATDLGGWDTLSEAQRQLVRSCAGLTILRENLDAKSVMGEPVDVGDYTRLTGALGRTLRLLGIDRKAKDVTPPDPLAYAKRRNRDADDIEEVGDDG